MLVALKISARLKFIDEPLVKRAELLISNVGLPVKIKNVTVNAVLNRHYHDKKFSGKNNKLVLISELGRARIVKNVPLGIIRSAVENRI